MNDFENKATKIWGEYQKTKGYQNSMGFTTDFPEIVRFKEGDQWPAPTKKTKNFPRPVFNITEMFIKNKRAAVTNQDLEISFRYKYAFEKDDVYTLKEQDIKSIVTKEQFSQMEYKVEE